MGLLRQQKRGKGSPKYIAPSHRYSGIVKYSNNSKFAEITELINCVGHQSPLMLLKDENNKNLFLTAPLGVKKGQRIFFGKNAPIIPGNVLPLAKIPTGTQIINLELRPGDGGKLVRTSGTSAQVIEKGITDAKIRLPSKRMVRLDLRCRATIGRVAGGGRKDKPYLRAGSKSKAMDARGKMFPRTHGVAMNPPDHPHGKTHRRHKGGPTTVKATAPPGQKVGKLSKKKRKK